MAVSIRDISQYYVNFWIKLSLLFACGRMQNSCIGYYSNATMFLEQFTIILWLIWDNYNVKTGTYIYALKQGFNKKKATQNKW